MWLWRGPDVTSGPLDLTIIDLRLEFMRVRIGLTPKERNRRVAGPCAQNRALFSVREADQEQQVNCYP